MGQRGNFHEMPSCIHTTIIIQTNIANILNEYGFLCTEGDIQIDSMRGTIFYINIEIDNTNGIPLKKENILNGNKNRNGAMDESPNY